MTTIGDRLRQLEREIAELTQQVRAKKAEQLRLRFQLDDHLHKQQHAASTKPSNALPAAMEELIEALANVGGTATVPALAQSLGKDVNTVNTRITRASQLGLVIRVAKGIVTLSSLVASRK